MLEMRHLEPASPDLAERITRAALQIEQKPYPVLLLWMQRKTQPIRLPHPVYGMVALLMLGLTLGLSSPASYLFNDNDEVAISSSSDSGEDIL